MVDCWGVEEKCNGAGCHWKKIEGMDVEGGGYRTGGVVERI